MKKNSTSTAVYVEENFSLTINEVCHSLGIEKKWVFEIIDEGIVYPLSSKNSQPIFDQKAITRLKTSLNLQRDLGINISGIALVLDLLDEIETIKRHS